MTFNVYDLEKVLRQEAERLKNDADNRADVKNDRPYFYEYIKAYTHYCQALIDLCADGGDKIYLETERDRQLVSMSAHVEKAERRYDLKSAREHLKRLEWPRIDYLLRVVNDDDLLKLEDSTRCPVPDDWEACIDNCIEFLCRKYSVSIPKAGE